MSEGSEGLESVVEEFVRRRFQVRAEDDQFGRDVNLWENGYVDSAGVQQMIAFLEETFQVKLPEEALFDPDFTTIQGISRIVERTRSAARAGAVPAANPAAAADAQRLDKLRERAERQREALANRKTPGRK